MQQREHTPLFTPFSSSAADLPRPTLPHAASSGLTSSMTGSDADTYRDDHEGGGGLLPPSARANPSSDSAAAKTGNHRSRRRLWLGLAAIVFLFLVVFLPVYFLAIKKNDSDSDGGDAHSDGAAGGGESGGSNGGTNSTNKALVVTGGDGSTVTSDSGETFIYNNTFGGYWLVDPENPFASGARANSWTPALNESWNWGVHRVYGVNLGGWFVLEPFIAPALFQAYPSARDEWDLASLMRADGTLQAKMEQHYDTFITEQDIAQIAGAGLNWVRLPIPFWAVATWSDVGVRDGSHEGEPFLEGACWKYIVRMFGWARKYGLRVNLDVHTAPGSQNGYNHSGKSGQINFLNGNMGLANAQRFLDYIRIITQFIMQPEYRDVVQMFGILNEPFLPGIGRDQVSSFYLRAHDVIRNITGYGNGPYISLHDGFGGISSWGGFLPGADRLVLDTHPYFSFGGGPNSDPIATGMDPDDAGGIWPAQACNAWGSSINGSRNNFGVTVAGEFSNGYNDCGLYLTGVNGSQSFGGDCKFWEDSSRWNAETKLGVMQFAVASMDALGDYFFWTWKIGKAADGIVRSPLWSYQLGLENGWMPRDPRTAIGKCASIGIRGNQFNGKFKAWQTGGAGAGTIAPSVRSEFAWPPATLSRIGAPMSLLPTYTATGSVPTLAYVTPTPRADTSSTPTPTVTMPNGWFDEKDTAGGMTAISGCNYPNAWRALDLPAPTARC
ncbi:glycoside hydrolase family 5 protein [Favolaschia claudopus]|uniref:glucan 1,3-beta-glucosidase n=1 Tax=Favolaschia claudopus TaxID=2862362 RepID=A0AAW0DNM8_9AGAR